MDNFKSVHNSLAVYEYRKRNLKVRQKTKINESLLAGINSKDKANEPDLGFSSTTRLRSPSFKRLSNGEVNNNHNPALETMLEEFYALK